MTRKMIVNAIDSEEIRIAVIDNGRLEDFDIETRGVEKNKGNIYKAIVMAVEPALNAAFVDYGADKQGFLTANDVDPRLSHHDDDERVYRITDLLKAKNEILVQVTKDEVGAKGAVLTTYLSLAGRYAVLMPGSARQGVSRKIEDEETRRKMREAAAMLDVPDNMGVIVRTAGRDRNKIELNRDLGVLIRLWENIQKEANASKAPSLIFKEQDVVIRALRDYYSDDIDEIVVDSDEAFDRANEYMHLVMPNQRSVLTRYVERRPIFHHYKIEEQLDALFSHKVTLPSGGSLVIEPTEALVSIDVNSGKQKLGGQEETALQTNLEAAREIARQLRLRDLGGIIVIDFIDMASRKHETRVEKAMRDALADDKARVKVGRISPNGTLELTRQRIRSALEVSIFQSCAVCHGTGHILKPEAHAVAVLRRLRDRASRGDLKTAKVRIEPSAANILRTEKWSAIQEIEQRYSIRVDIMVEHSFAPGQDDFTFETNPEAVPLPIEEPNFGPAPRFDPETGEPIPEALVAREAAAARREREESRDEGAEEGRGGRRGRRGRRGREEGEREARGDGGQRDGRGERGDRPRREEPGVDELGIALPSFELLDPEDVGLGADNEDREDREDRDEAEGAGGEGRGRRRGRRGGRRRRGKREGGGLGLPEMTAAQALAGGHGGSVTPMPQPQVQAPVAHHHQGGGGGAAAAAAPAGEKKTGFWARLFGKN